MFDTENVRDESNLFSIYVVNVNKMLLIESVVIYLYKVKLYFHDLVTSSKNDIRL